MELYRSDKMVVKYLADFITIHVLHPQVFTICLKRDIFNKVLEDLFKELLESKN